MKFSRVKLSDLVNAFSGGYNLIKFDGCNTAIIGARLDGGLLW